MAVLLWLVLFAPGIVLKRSAVFDNSLRTISDPARRYQLQNERLKLENDVRVALLQGLGGAAVLLGAFVAYRQFQTGREQLKVAQEGQITERFTRAVDQLGNVQPDVRLGGVYGLARIAKDSPPDRATIAEILAAYIRGHAPWPPPSGPIREAPSWLMTHGDDYLSQEAQVFVLSESIKAEHLPLLQSRAPDIQAALNVIAQELCDVTESVNLRSVDLRKANLRRAYLRGSDLTGTRLDGADLTGAHLEGAILCETSLVEAKLSEAHLNRDHPGEPTCLVKANLQRAKLIGTTWSGRISPKPTLGAPLRTLRTMQT